MERREFSVAGAVSYDRRGPRRWLLAHLLRYKRLLLLFVLGIIVANALTAAIPLLTGRAFTAVQEGTNARAALTAVALALVALALVRGGLEVATHFATEFLGKRLERDAREELALGLLGKSQTFHNRQQTGDIMARATNDMTLLSDMVAPGVDLIVDSVAATVLPLLAIALLDSQLLLTPLLFVVVLLIALRDYMRRLGPVSGAMRAQFGAMNAGLAETITGIDVVKASVREGAEQQQFEQRAQRYRDLFVANGRVQARYLPVLLLGIATALGFLHGVWLVAHGQISTGELVAFLGLMGALGYPTNVSLWTFSLVQLGVAAAGRILQVLNTETELDQNRGGHGGRMQGEIVFEHVTFRYDGAPVLEDLSFHARPGETVALVGQTGSGKSTLTKLVNRIYDVDAGRVLVDGVDVRHWDLDDLRSQVSTIEQDIFLFSRSIRENIAFGLGGQADDAAVEQAARDAQAHGFITGFQDGYDTEVGERGVTLSGGQRQRIAIARALLTDPRILIIDDSTSAVDSATEDEIQRAIARVLHGRTTLLITHRLSQIRRADRILILAGGRLVDSGNHDELLGRCELYRRMFGKRSTAATVAP